MSSKIHLQTLAMGFALSGLISLTGCGPSGNPAPVPDANPPRAPSAKVVSVYSWESYFDPEVCSLFEKETGITIEWHYFQNLGEMNAQLRSQPDAFDVVVLDDMSLGELIELQLLRPLPASSIPNLSHIDSRYLDLPFDPGNRFSVPYMWGTTLLAYRKDHLENPEQSWSLLWNPDYRGKVSMINERQDAYSICLMFLGKDLNSNDPGDLEAATDKLLEQVRAVHVNYGDLESLKEEMKSGKCWIAPLYSGDAALIASEDENIGFFIPKEGAPLWLDSFAVPKDSPRVPEAVAFIDFMSRPEIAARNANHLSYATANRSALPLLSAELRDNPSVFPPAEVLARCGFIRKATLQRDRLTNQGMKRIFDALHGFQPQNDNPDTPTATGGTEP